MVFLCFLPFCIPYVYPQSDYSLQMLSTPYNFVSLCKKHKKICYAQKILPATLYRVVTLIRFLQKEPIGYAHQQRYIARCFYQGFL